MGESGGRSSSNGRKVSGRGPVPSTLLCCGEAPGFWEERKGQPFVGDTGFEMARYLHLAKLTRDPFINRDRPFLRDVYLTNVVKYRPATRGAQGNKQPSPEEIARDEGELLAEVRKVRPRYIAAIGAVAARWFCGSEFSDLEERYGLPFRLSKRRTKQLGYAAPDAADAPWVFPLYHPAAGFHAPGLQPHIYDGFMQLGQYIHGKLPLVTPVDMYPDPDYYLVRSPSVSLIRTRPIYIDTEGLLGNVWGLSFTQVPGSAGIIKIDNRRALNSFRDQLRGMQIVAHHFIHDAPIIAELLRMTVAEFLKWIGGFDDTMVKAFVLRMPPLALKPSCRRYHGMSMESFPDVVRDADKEIVTNYLKQLLRVHKCADCGGAGVHLQHPISAKTGKPLMPRVVNCASCEGDGTAYPSPEEYLEYENGVAKLKRGERVGGRVRRIIRDLRTKPDTNPRERWERIDYDYRIKIEDVVGELRDVSLNDVEPQERAITYSGRDADGTIRYDGTLDTMLDADESGKLRQVYELDRDALPLLIRMMEVGTLVDAPFLRKFATRLESENDRIAYKLQRIAGRYVNPGSPKQVRELLFDDMGLPAGKMTPTDDPSTADGVLEDLKIEVAGWESSQKRDEALKVLNFITDYRERDKLRGTYAVKLPRSLSKDGRVRTEFRATNTESGRYSSADPNLQNIPDPNKSELGGLIRKAFVAPDGYSLVETDYGQVEARFAAHDSQDERLCTSIINGLDIHTQTAVMLFDLPADQITKHQRRVSKTITFSILYGITARSLRARIKLETGLDVAEETCQGYIDRYKEVAYPGIGMYILECEAFARRTGYAECMFGRRRYLPGMHSFVNKVRTEAERIATNHRVQASCAGIMKKAAPIILDEVLPYVRKKGWDCDPLLTVHDSLLFQVKKGGEETLIKAASAAMAGVVKLRVPLTVDGHAGDNWGACK